MIERLPRGRRALIESAGVVVGVIVGVYVAMYVLSDLNPLSDAHAYWSRDLANLYAVGPASTPGTFVYSPAIAQLMTPLTAIPWPAFLVGWLGVLVATVIVLAGPFSALAFFLPPVVLELRVGNIHLLVAAASILGLRWPAAWAFVLLTKVTPGIGVLWFAFRGEWRKLGVALGVTAAIAAVSFVLAPGLWFDWITAIAASTSVAPPGNSYAVPLAVRLPIAVALVALGARRGWPALVPIAVVLAMPILWTNALAGLLGAVYLVRRSPRQPASSNEIVSQPSPVQA